MPSFELPFNERIRTYLRLEGLFQKILHHVEAGHEQNHHVALVTIVQMLDVVDRVDLKVDLLQEIDRQKVRLESLREMPNVEREKLNETIHQFEKSAQALRAEHQKIGQVLRDNEWIMAVKQRANVAGGLCDVELPSYHYWLCKDGAERKSDLNFWLVRFMPVYHAVSHILQILRGCSKVTNEVAVKGSYQQQLSGVRPVQLLRIDIEDIVGYPEISANKYAINIRFCNFDSAHRSRQIDIDIPFAMHLCNFSSKPL